MSEQSQVIWFVARNGAQHGPLSEHDLHRMLGAGQLLPTDLVWRDGFPSWLPSHQVFRQAVPQPPPIPAMMPAMAPPQPVHPAPTRPAHAPAAAREEQTCPHCHTAIPLSATVCRGCGAKEGYFTKDGSVYGVFYCVFAALFTGGVGMAALVGASNTRNSGAMLVAAVGGAVCLYFVYVIMRGPRWFR